MRQITRYEELAPLLSAQLGRGVVTNAALTAEDWRREIAAGTLRCQSWAGGLVLLRRREGRSLMNFYLRELSLPDDLAWDSPVVLEIAARPRDEGLLRVADFWRGQGFEELYRRERLVLPKDTKVPAGDGPLTARVAEMADAEAVRTLLQDNFDPLTGCLPTAEELERDLASGNVVCVDGPDGRTAGLLHITPGRGSTQLRHLAVGKPFRRQGGAQALLARYLERTGFVRSLVWVRTDNEPGRRFYVKNGYAPDGWSSTVLCRP